MNSVSSVSDKISNLIWSQLQLLTNRRGLDLHLVKGFWGGFWKGLYHSFYLAFYCIPTATQLSDKDLTLDQQKSA